MLTIFLALINAKYRADYEGTFFLTFVLDFAIIVSLFNCLG